jgi:hypothetical protein
VLLGTRNNLKLSCFDYKASSLVNVSGQAPATYVMYASNLLPGAFDK